MNFVGTTIRRWRAPLRLSASRCVTTGVLASVILSVTTTASGGVEYTITDLGNLGGYSVKPAAINNRGEVVGTASVGPSGANHAFLYSNGVMTDLGTLGGFESGASAINDAGQVVGGAEIPTLRPGQSVRYHAFLYTGGKMQDLGTLPGMAYSGANSINNAGQIVGESGSQAFFYSNGRMTPLSTFAAESIFINNAGHIAGTYQAGSMGIDVVLHPLLYEEGKTTDLGTLGANLTFAHALNDADQIVGIYNAIDNTPGYRGFLYTGGKMTDIGTIYPEGLNNHGDVVGYSGSGSSAAVLYRAGAMVNLNRLIDPASRWKLTDAQAINDEGQIVGFGIAPSGRTDAFLLTPLPEPVGCGLLAMGLLMLAARRQPRRL